MAKDFFSDSMAEDISKDTTVNVDTGKSKEPLPAGEKTFELEKLRLSQNFGEIAGVKKALLTVPVRKPGKQDFITVHSCY